MADLQPSLAHLRPPAADWCAMPKRTRSAAPAPKSTKVTSKPATSRKRPAMPRRTGKTLSSRGVLREVEPGSTVECVHCGERIKFQARMRHKQVICNVYVAKRWDRVEHFHAPCYEEAGEPYGEPDTTPPERRPKSARAAEAAKEADVPAEPEPAGVTAS